MAQVIETIDVDVPVRTAYNQWTQFETFPNFLEHVESVKQLDDTHTHWKVKIGGAEREFDAVITEQHPDERVAWKSTSGNERHAGVVTFHRLSDTTTRVTVQLEWDPEGFVEKVGSVFVVDTHMVKKDLERFKVYVEEPKNQTEGWRGDVTI